MSYCALGRIMDYEKKTGGHPFLGQEEKTEKA